MDAAVRELLLFAAPQLNQEPGVRGELSWGLLWCGVSLCLLFGPGLVHTGRVWVPGPLWYAGLSFPINTASSPEMRLRSDAPGDVQSGICFSGG